MPTRPPIFRPSGRAPMKSAARSAAGEAAQRLYNWRWRKESRRFLAEHPLCDYCRELGRVTASSVTDHRIPHRGDPAVFWDRSNWVPSCKPCHDGPKQRAEKGGVAPTDRVPRRRLG